VEGSVSHAEALGDVPAHRRWEARRPDVGLAGPSTTCVTLSPNDASARRGRSTLSHFESPFGSVEITISSNGPWSRSASPIASIGFSDLPFDLGFELGEQLETAQENAFCIVSL